MYNGDLPMHRKPIKGCYYYYMSVRSRGKITTIYLGPNQKNAEEREKALKAELGIEKRGRPLKSSQNPRFLSCSKHALLILFIMPFILLNSAASAQASTYKCTTCTVCTNYLLNSSMSSGDTLQLTANIDNYAGIDSKGCINFGGKDGIIFDCLGHTIDGNDLGSDYGIWLNNTGDGSNNNILNNCTLTDFYKGIYTLSSSNNTFMNINAISNNYSIQLDLGSKDNLTNINASYNSMYGIYIGSVNNTLMNISVQENAIIGIYIPAGIRF